MESLPPIPTPPAERWREFRIQALPLMTFVAVLLGVRSPRRPSAPPRNPPGPKPLTPDP